MLKKLLKYDLKAMFKIWWIPALTTFVLSIFDGLSQMVYYSEKTLPDVVYIFTSFVAGITTISYVVFVILTVALIFSRFYKNFYTDEGYLTFTLPVKKTQHINSKLISSTLASWATGLVLVINAIVTFLISECKNIKIDEYDPDVPTLGELLSSITTYEWVMFFEGVAIALLLPIVANLFLFFCISIGSTVVKRAKVITSIAIFYGVTSVLFVALQILLIFGIDSIEGWLVDLSSKMYDTAVTLILLVIILFIVMIAGILYTLQYWMLDRKLNLS